LLAVLSQERSGSKAGPHILVIVDQLERTSQANEAAPYAVDGVLIVVVDGCRSEQTRCELVFSQQACAPSVGACYEGNVAPVVDLRRDGQLVGCLEGISCTNSPFRHVSVYGRAGSPATVELEVARTDVSSKLTDDSAFFDAEVVNAPDGDVGNAE